MKYNQYLEYMTPKYMDPEILEVLSSIQSSIRPQNNDGIGRMRSDEPKHSQNAQFKHNLASNPGILAESPSLFLSYN